MSKKRMSAKSMEAAPENQAGQYGASFWFQLIVSWAESKFPGAGAILEKAAEVMSWSKLGKAIFNAYADFKEGKDFLQILREMLDEWVTVEENADGDVIRMSAKS